MPTANEMFNAYFAPAAQDWQRESHLRTNAMKRAEMQRMEDLHMADWEKKRSAPAPVAPTPEIPMMATPSPVAGAISTVAKTELPAWEDQLMAAKTVRKNLVQRQADEIAKATRAKYPGRKLTQADVDRINAEAERLADANDSPEYAKIREVLAKDRENAAKTARDAEVSGLMTGLTDAQKSMFRNNNLESQSAGTSSSTSVGGGGVEMSTSTQSNQAANALRPQVTNFLSDLMSQKSPKTEAEAERANFIRSQLPALEEELMLTGGAEEYRKRLSDIETGIAAKEKTFADNQIDMAKHAATVMGQMGQNERAQLKLEHDTIKEQLAADTKIKAAEIVTKGRLGVAGIGAQKFMIPVLVQLLKNQKDLVVEKIKSATGLGIAGIWNNKEIDALRLAQANDMLNANLAAVIAQIPTTARESYMPMLAKASQEIYTEAANELIPTKEGNPGTPAKEGYFTKDGWGSKPAVQPVIVKGQAIKLPELMSGGKGDKPSGAPKFANRAAMLAYAMTLPASERAAFRKNYANLK